jgi:hypothetical protein
VRAIDADKLKEVLEKNFGHTGGALALAQLIDAQDAIQPEPHWIPVEQDTPTEDDDYWATFEAETGRFVDWASWYQGRWVTWIEGSPAPLSNVIAWCKPMEPYKGVTE